MLKPVDGQHLKGTAEYCCICIPGCACVERFDDLLRPHISLGIIRYMPTRGKFTLFQGFSIFCPMHQNFVP